MNKNAATIVLRLFVNHEQIDQTDRRDRVYNRRPKLTIEVQNSVNLQFIFQQSYYIVIERV